MTFQAYLDSIKAKTGKTTEDFRKLVAKKGLTKFGDVVAWLKADFGLGHGHASAMAQLLVNADKFKAQPGDRLAAHFTGAKAKWRTAYDALAAEVSAFGADVKLAANQSYINLQRGTRKIGIVQVSSAERLDIGIKLKGHASGGRLEAAGSWNTMVSHRVRISDPKQIDKQVVAWLQEAYTQAGPTQAAPPRPDESRLRRERAPRRPQGDTMTATQQISDYVASLDDWRGKLLARLRKLIVATGPELSEEWKWDTPVWAHQGNVVAAAAFKGTVKLNFFKGASLPDPHGLFNAGLEAKATRAIDFHEGDKVDEAALKALIRAAVAANAAGGRKK